MTPNPFFVSPGEVVCTVVIIMIRHGLSGLPVVRDKKIVGIVTKSDIVNVSATKGKF